MPSENIFVLFVNFITSLLNVNIISIIKKKKIYKHFLLIQKDLKNYFNITARDLKKKIDKSSCFIINLSSII